MAKKDSGFSLVELIIVVSIIIVLAAIAIPNFTSMMKGYRLHADASAIASQLNATRLRATSQFTPCRLVLSVTAGSFTRERLATDYSSPTPEQVSYLSTGITRLPGDPVSAKPGNVSLSFSGASAAIYFNTRGLPVDSSGSPTPNSVFYLQNQDGLYDAVTVSLGGQISVWTYSTVAVAWTRR